MEQSRIGWWEWVRLPGLHPVPFRAKVDTGAGLSALHAEQVEISSIGELNVVRFQVDADGPLIELPSADVRGVRSSNGEAQKRPVVLLPVEVAGRVFAIECTLTDRTPMAYPMLLGRAALAGRFLVDPAYSRLHPKPRGRR